MNYYAIDNNGYYLAHHGIKGQKWGRRNYQNPDGSYTAAGRQRYGIGYRINRSFNKTGEVMVGVGQKTANRGGAVNRAIGRAWARQGGSLALPTKARMNRREAIKNSRGIHKIGTAMGYGRNAREANSRTMDYAANYNRKMAGMYGKNPIGKVQSNRWNRGASVYESVANRNRAYQKSRDRGNGLVRSYINGQKAMYGTKTITTIRGKQSTVGKEMVKAMLVSTAANTAVQLYKQRNG